jgi:hypothetical protein
MTLMSHALPSLAVARISKASGVYGVPCATTNVVPGVCVIGPAVVKFSGQLVVVGQHRRPCRQIDARWVGTEPGGLGVRRQITDGS